MSNNLRSTEELSRLMEEYAAKQQTAGTLTPEEQQSIQDKQAEQRRNIMLAGFANAAGTLAGAPSGQTFTSLGDPLLKAGELSKEEAQTLMESPKARAAKVMKEYQVKKDALNAQQRDELAARSQEQTKQRMQEQESGKDRRFGLGQANIEDRFRRANYTTDELAQMSGLPNRPSISQDVPQPKESDISEKPEIKLPKSNKQKEMESRQIKELTESIDKNQFPSLTNAAAGINDILKKHNVDINNPKSYKKDLPGIGLIDSSLPGFATTQDGVDLKQNLQIMANSLLKQRSGSAVTDPEYRRFLLEVQAGKFASEREILSGYRKMVDNLKSLSSNIESKDKKILNLYKERGGRLPSETLKQITESPNDTITIQDSKGKTHTILKSNLEAAKQRDPNLKVLK